MFDRAFQKIKGDHILDTVYMDEHPAAESAAVDTRLRHTVTFVNYRVAYCRRQRKNSYKGNGIVIRRRDVVT